MARENTTHIRLIHCDGREETVKAPDGFSWKPYPTQVEVLGKRWEYVGTLEAYPHYKELIR